MKIKNIGKRPHIVLGKTLNVEQEIEIDDDLKKEVENLHFLKIKDEKRTKIKKEVKKSSKINIEDKKEDIE